jgi:hypothetical protein
MNYEAKLRRNQCHSQCFNGFIVIYNSVSLNIFIFYSFMGYSLKMISNTHIDYRLHCTNSIDYINISIICLFQNIRLPKWSKMTFQILKLDKLQYLILKRDFYN